VKIENKREAVITRAKKLLNGGVIYEMDTITTAEWLRTKEAREAFKSCFGGVASIKDRTTAMFIEYVPVSFTPESSENLRKVEQDAGLKEGDLKQVRWVKAIERRADGQRTAHIIANVASVQVANKMLRDGVHIHGKKVNARKMKREPRRCLKCQKINVRHFAKECPSILDVCGTCGLNHCTNACIVTDESQYEGLPWTKYI